MFTPCKALGISVGGANADVRNSLALGPRLRAQHRGPAELPAGSVRGELVLARGSCQSTAPLATKLRLNHGQGACQHRNVRTQALVVAPAAAATAPQSPTSGNKVLSETKFDDAGLNVEARLNGDVYEVNLSLDHPRPMMLHWAADDWCLPPREAWPPGTRQEGDQAVQTPFGQDGRLRLTLHKDHCPQRLVWVCKQEGPGEAVWLNNNGLNYGVQLRAPGMEGNIAKALAAESTYSNWSLFQRLCMVVEMLDSAEAAGPSGMAFLFAWLRLSQNRVLDWYRNMCYQPKDLAHTQKWVAERFADKSRTAEDPMVRLMARMALAGLPRGGGNGDEIRMGILNIMRSNGIREGHRPGHDEPFLEQWHQKLHTNTTPDDVAICTAYLAYLHSGNHDDYWRVLWDVGRVTREKLETMNKPIKAWPQHLPHLIGPFQHYLWILKVTHSGADLDTAFEMAKGCMDGDLRWVISDILANRNEWWVPGKVVEARQRLAQYAQAPGASRDLLLLDIALDSWLRVCLERTLGSSDGLKADDRMALLGLVLANEAVTWPGEELAQCRQWWERLTGGGAGNRWSREWALEALAALQRTQLSLSAHMDRIYGLVQPHAEAFHSACKFERMHVDNFGEEVVRGLTLSLAASLLAGLEPDLRRAAGVASWQVVSAGIGSSLGTYGTVESIGSLADVQGKEYDKPTVLLCGKVGGTEDIPRGVTAVLSPMATDVLSHLAIRARSQGVLLAACFDGKEWQDWQAKAGQVVSVAVNAEGAVVPGEAPAAAAAVHKGHGNGNGTPKVQVVRPVQQSAWALQEGDFRQGSVGAKALNLAALRSKLPQWVRVPASVALPFGTFERVLADPANANLAQRITQLAGQAQAAPNLPAAAAALAELRQLVSEGGLAAPQALISELAVAAAGQGLILSADVWTSPSANGSAGAVSWRATWSAICAVWASKWTDRAWLSRRSVGIPDSDLYMSVLLQQVVPSQYAFVLHTANPVNHTPGQLLGEVVVGMGESLVGNTPGRALAFTADIRGGAGAVGATELHALPSKRTGLFAPVPATLIARSDANAEDLEEYAAAGLYDSVTLQPLKEGPVAYASDGLVTDPGFRSSLLGSLAALGAEVKAALGGVAEQDVEGAWVDGQVYVVQARPQVAL